MASTATTRLRLEKQGTGDNNNSWGNKLNTTGLDLIDSAIAGMATYTLSGPKTLTSNNYAADEARMPFQNITGGTGGTITVPSAEGRYFFRNASSGDVIVTTGSGATATLASGDATAVHCDGVNVYTALTKSYVDTAIANAAFGGISLGAGMQAFLQTPTSANFFGTLTTKTGTAGTVVFSVSPALTGTPTAPTAVAGTNTTQIATTEFVAAAVAATGSITASSTNTLTNKNISLANNTLVGTKAQFNTACSDGDFAFTSDLASYQPLDSDLTAIAALTTATFGRALLTMGDGPAVRTAVGAGTVTSVSVATANGVSGTVATSTTTPAIMITLGAITPSSVVASGNVTGFSDERHKANWRPLATGFVAGLAAVKHGIYDRTDCELTQVGVSAQSLRELLPDAVPADDEGMLSVAYGNAALVSCIALAREMITLQDEVASLRERIA